MIAGVYRRVDMQVVERHRALMIGRERECLSVARDRRRLEVLTRYLVMPERASGCRPRQLCYTARNLFAGGRLTYCSHTARRFRARSAGRCVSFRPGIGPVMLHPDQAFVEIVAQAWISFPWILDMPKTEGANDYGVPTPVRRALNTPASAVMSWRSTLRDSRVSTPLCRSVCMVLFT